VIDAIQRAHWFAGIAVARADPEATGAIARAVIEAHDVEVHAMHRQCARFASGEVERSDAFLVADQKTAGGQQREAAWTVRQHTRFACACRPVEAHDLALPSIQ
jgi:hypothetical protein